MGSIDSGRRDYFLESRDAQTRDPTPPYPVSYRVVHNKEAEDANKESK